MQFIRLSVIGIDAVYFIFNIRPLGVDRSAQPVFPEFDEHLDETLVLRRCLIGVSIRVVYPGSAGIPYVTVDFVANGPITLG